jgi:hypothetical protein
MTEYATYLFQMTSNATLSSVTSIRVPPEITAPPNWIGPSLQAADLRLRQAAAHYGPVPRSPREISIHTHPKLRQLRLPREQRNASRSRLVPRSFRQAALKWRLRKTSYRRGRTRARGLSDQSIDKIAPDWSSLAQSAIAVKSAAPRNSGVNGWPRRRMTLGAAALVCASICGKSRSFVRSTYPCSRA